MAAGDKKARHHRTMDAIVYNTAIMDGASALDWRVLHAIAVYQGYQTWRCRLSLDRIAKIARCSKRAACRSTQWWRDMGAIAIMRTGKFNVFEILQNLRPSPEIVHGQRQFSHEKQKRGPRGRFVPSTELPSSRSAAIPSSRSAATITRSLEQDVLNESPPPPPTGGNGRSSETSARPSHTLIISDHTIREMLKIKTEKEVLELLKKGGYPVPPFLQDQGQAPGSGPAPRTGSPSVLPGKPGECRDSRREEVKNQGEKPEGR